MNKSKIGHKPISSTDKSTDQVGLDEFLISGKAPRDMKFDIEKMALAKCNGDLSSYDFNGVWTALIYKALAEGYVWPVNYDNPKERERFIRLHNDGHGGKVIYPLPEQNYNIVPGVEPGLSFINSTHSIKSGDTKMKKDTHVNTERVLNLLDDSFKTIKVVFNPPQAPVGVKFDADKVLGGFDTYTYKVPKSFEIKPGNLVTVISDERYQVVMVKSIDAEPDLEADVSYKWICGAIDLDMYNSCQERDKDLRAIIMKKEKKVETDKMRAFLQDSLGIDGVSTLKLTEIKVDGQD